MTELEAALDDAWFKKLFVRRFFTTFMTRYLNSLVTAIRDPSKKAVKLISAGFTDALNGNATEMQEFWDKVLEGTKGRAMVESYVNGVVVVSELLRVDNSVALNNLIVQRILDNYGDCPTALIEAIFEARPNLDKSKRKEFNNIWKERIAYQARDASDRPTAGWSQEPSALGLLDKISAGPDGWFNSRKKREAAEKKLRQAQEDAERLRRKEERSKKKEERSKKKIRGAMAVPSAGGGSGGGEHEVESLSSLLGK
jgi:hypothetical protein